MFKFGGILEGVADLLVKNGEDIEDEALRAIKNIEDPNRNNI